MVEDAAAYPGSSATAHLSGNRNGLVNVEPLREMVGNWKAFLLSSVPEEMIERICRHGRTGRPLGKDGFVEKVELALGRILQRQKPGREKGAEPEIDMAYLDER